MTPCDREQHATRDDALECVRRRCAERAARRSTTWQAQFDRLLLLHADQPDDQPDDQTPELLPDEWRGQFIATVAADGEFCEALTTLIGGAR